VVGKKIKNPKKSASKSQRVKGLSDYIRQPEHEGGGGVKCVHSGSRGFVSETHEEQKEEMIALAEGAPLSRDPISHYMLSWREGETPTAAQVEKAVDIVLGELGLKDHQCIFGLHNDTDNMHLHISVNRIHPVTLRAVDPNHGWDIEAIHKAVARIEHEQGWKREKNGRYLVRDGEVVRSTSKIKALQPSQRAKDFEHRTGEKSAERIGIDSIPAIIRDSSSWGDLHRRMAGAGMRYERKGSGAVIFVSDQPIKASTADRGASLGKLERRFGPYRGPEENLRVTDIGEKPLPSSAPASGGESYHRERKEHYAAKKAVLDALKSRIEAERKELFSRQKKERDEIFTGNWKGRGKELNELRSILAAEHAVQKAEILELHRDARDELRQEFPPFPDIETWLGRRGLDHHWRYRHDGKGLSASIEGEGPPRAIPPGDIRDFSYQVRNGAVFFSRRDEDEAAFIDRGKRIDVRDVTSRDSVLAALQLAAQKWDSINISGSDEFKDLCVGLAVEHGFRIANPDLHERIQKERDSREIERRGRSKGRQREREIEIEAPERELDRERGGMEL
jgi:hypothetical protein